MNTLGKSSGSNDILEKNESKSGSDIKLFQKMKSFIASRRSFKNGKDPSVSDEDSKKEMHKSFMLSAASFKLFRSNPKPEEGDANSSIESKTSEKHKDQLDDLGHSFDETQPRRTPSSNSESTSTC